MHRKLLRRIEPVQAPFGASVELLDLKQTAVFLRVSVPTIRRLQQQREVSFIKVGRSIRFAKSDLIDYLTRKRVPAIHELM